MEVIRISKSFDLFEVQPVVPVAYLQFWSKDGKPKGRKTKIYVTDKTGSDIRPVSKTAVVKNFYSKNNPNAAEEYFQEIGVDFVKNIVDKGCMTQPKLVNPVALERNPRVSETLPIAS